MSASLFFYLNDGLDFNSFKGISIIIPKNGNDEKADNILFDDFFSVLTIAQNAPAPDYKITGRVTDSKNIPVPFANVVLYNSSYTVFTKGSATDNDGKFEILAIPGSYYLKISFLSFQTKAIPNIRISNQHLALNKIILAENSELIEEVVVKGQKSQMQFNLDKKVFNVGSDNTNLGGSEANI